MTKEFVGATVALFIGLCGFLFTYWHQRRRDRRVSRLDRVNLQLRNLYGPLYASLQSNSATWDAFTKNHWPAHGGKSYFEPGKPLTNAERERWRLWMVEVFSPQNEQIAKLILENGDLVDGSELPSSFVATLAHVSAYRAVVKDWANGNFDESTSILNFPSSQLIADVDPIYQRLRGEQEILIAQVQAQP